MLTYFFSDLATGISSFVTTFVEMIVSMFTGLFLVTGESGAITGISPIAQVALAFLAIYMCYKYLPTVIGWFKLRARNGRKKRARAK